MFVILRLVARRRLPDGTVFWTFIALYGLFRCCIEFFREPDQQLGFLVGWVTMGQLLSLPMLVVRRNPSPRAVVRPRGPDPRPKV